MYDLSDCAIIIPVQIDSEERLEHIHFLYRYFNRFFFNHELLILEQGVIRQIHLPANASTRLEFIRQEGAFSPALASNLGAAIVDRPFFCKYDADVFIHPKALFDAFERLKQDLNQSLVLPYNGVSFSIENDLRAHILKTIHFTSLPWVSQKDAKIVQFHDMTLKCENSQGLIHHFRTAVFKELGGYNEHFIGWGYEDSEMISRFHTLGVSKATLEQYNAFHLEHPRLDTDPAQVFKNYCIKQVVNAMSSNELRDYIKTWNRFYLVR